MLVVNKKPHYKRRYLEGKFVRFFNVKAGQSWFPPNCTTSLISKNATPSRSGADFGSCLSRCSLPRAHATRALRPSPTRCRPVSAGCVRCSPLQADAGRPHLLAIPASFTHNSRIDASGILGEIMFAFAVRSGDFRFSLALATALCLLIWPAVGWAYTAEQQQACTDDAFRLCSAEIPDVDRVTACMVRQQTQLSPGCRVYFRPDPPAEPVRAGMPLSIKPAHMRKPRKPKKPG
jgi:hypothetical protein